MSRNIGDTSCSICNGKVVLEEAARPIAASECHVYADEYVGKLLVANAHCFECEAKYLAWVAAVPRSSKDRGHFHRTERDDREFVDLSFRRAFNDEPAPEDLPSKERLQLIHARNSIAAAKEFRDDAADLLAKAEALERDATEKPSYWEAYRRESP